MKRIQFRLAVIFMIGFIVSGCASLASSSFFGPGNFYSDTVTVGAKRGEASGMVIFGVFGKVSYPPVEEVARDNGITKIATVEHYAKIGFMGFWITYTTIVTGE